MALIGADIGGTKFLVAAADRPGTILRSTQASTPLNRAEGLALLKTMIREVAAGDPVEAIGASCGGPLDPFRGIVSPLHQPEWREVPLREIFESEFHCPFRVEVDTDAAALAEYRFGPIQPARMLYLTLSTGMGGGFLIDGAIYRGSGGAHAEAGHQAIPYRLRNHAEPVLCECGATGCLEALVSGNGIRRLYGRKAEELSAEEWEEVGHNLGMGLRNLAVLYAPEVVVLGGGVVTGGGPRFLPAAERVMREGMRLVPAPRLAISSLGYNTALLGAVALAQDCCSGHAAKVRGC
jgi:predicted NBD/HSP70 family sugar kinase